jgi:hypothetical protein
MLTARHLNSGQRHRGGNEVPRWNAGQKDSNFFRPPPMARLKPLPYPPLMTVRRPSGFIEPCLPSKAARPPTRAIVGSRNQARRLSADGASRWPAHSLLHPQRS